MNPALSLTLTWDLVIIVFVAIVIAYSFIVGRAEALKIIIATYIAAIAVQGLGGVLGWLFAGSASMLEPLGMSADVPYLAGSKLLLFVTAIILLTIRAGVAVEQDGPDGITGTLFTGACGFATAGLLLTTLLTYIAGSPLLDPFLSVSPALAPLLLQSRLVGIVVDYQQFWYALPALLLIVGGFLETE